MFYIIKQIFNEIKWAWQRVFRGYDDRWHWSLCDSLAKVVSENLEWLIENQSGCPDNLCDKSKVGEECHKWKQILKEIKQGFDAFIEMGEYYNADEYEVLRKQYNKGMKLFAKYFGGLWN